MCINWCPTFERSVLQIIYVIQRRTTVTNGRQTDDIQIGRHAVCRRTGRQESQGRRTAHACRQTGRAGKTKRSRPRPHYELHTSQANTGGQKVIATPKKSVNIVSNIMSKYNIYVFKFQPSNIYVQMSDDLDG